ncbi:MAG: hypothetical protein KKD05_03890, partial [Candidatus Omnitrophica bacterium]|nr:hypothetical protein [Candidatus Omnitrophota bacterium]
MYDQTGKLWFKIMAFIVLEAFLFTIADISWAANYRDQRGSQQMLLDSQKNKNEKDNVSAEALSNQLVLTQPAMPYMGFGQITPQGQELESVSLIDTTISGLSIAGNDLSDIFKTLKSSGCSVSEAGFGAMRQGFNKKEIYHSLISAGYDKEEVKTLLGSLLIMEEEIKKDEEEAVQTKTGPPQAQSEQAKTTLNQKKAIFEIPSLTDLPVEKDVTKVVEKTVQQGAVLRQTVEFVRLMLNEGKRGKELIRILKKSGLSNERITTALAQLGFNLKDIISILKDSDISCTDIVQAIYNSQINYSDKDIYTALLKAGFSDEEIISALKTVGMNAVDILKLTTELGRNMIQVADAMVKAGFNVAEIANAYVLKAMKWTWDNSVNVINCAVKAFDAFLTNIGKKFSSKQDLAYELIIDDILATGEVLIQDQDVMTSMAAIKNVAQNHGIDLQGYNLSLDSLLELEGVSVVHLDGNHWVTLVGVEGDQVTIIDNGKEEVISLSEFQIRWDGNVLAVNQQEINQNKLLDLQMRDIRGGRGFNPFKAISNVFKGVVEGVKTFVQGVVNIVKGAVQMAIATVTLDWERFKTGFWTATMGTFQTLTAPIVTLYHFLPESVARIVGMVIKTIIIAVFTVIGGIIGTILGGNTNAGMAIGAFVGTIVGYCFDYDMVMACKNNDVDAFKVVFKRMIIEAVVNAAVAFCMSYASVPGGSGTVAGNIASTTTAATAGAGVGATTGTMISTAVSSQAVQNLVVSAAVSALKQTLVTYALTYSMDAAGVTNPYLRAISVGAAGAWAGGDAGKISFTETGGWQMADLMSKHIAKQMVVGAVTSVSMEAIKQQGYEQGWDPLVTECAALAVGTFANIGISSGLGLQNNLKAPAQTSFTSLVVSNFQSSIGGLIGALAAKVVDRICLENGVDPILSAALSSTVENLTGSLSTAAFSDQKSFSMTDLGNALKSGLGAGLSAAYKDVLIRNFDYSEREASEAVYNTSVVASTVTKFYDAFSSDKAITTQEFNSKLDNLMQSAFTSGLEGLGFNNGFNGKMSSYEQVEYLDTWDQEIDTMEYLMTAQGSGIYLDDAGVYRNADGSENTYLNRNKARSDYNQEWKEKKPEVFDTKKSSSSDTASGNLSFGDALTKTIDTRMLSFQTTQASANFTTAVNRLHVNYNISQINSTADKLGVTAQLANGGGVMLTLTQQVLNNPALRDTALTNLLNYGTNATMLYGATTDNITGIMFDNSDSFFTGTASAYQQENNGKLEWARPETVETGSNTYIKAGVKADTVYDLVNNQNLSFVATQTNSFANMTSTNAFILNGNVSYDQTNGTFFLQNASFTALNGLKTVDFSTKLTNGDKVYASVVSDQGFNNTVLRTGTGQSADVYKTQLGGVAKELRIEDITSKASDKVSSLEVALTVSVSGNLNLESASLKEVNNRLTT